MRISLIAAMDRNRVIGRENDLPWHLPADLQWFKKNTLGKPIVMGRKTFESIGYALPARTNLVLSRDRNFNASGCMVVHTIDSAISAAEKALDVDDGDEIVVIGGAQLFEQLIKRAERLYLTRIDADFDGDAYFPEIDPKEWRVIWQEELRKSEGNLFGLKFLILDRVEQTKTSG